MARYVVAQKCSILLPDRTLLRPGQDYPAKDLPRKLVEDHKKSGHIIEKGDDIDPGALPPGVETPETVKAHTERMTDQVETNSGSSDPYSPVVKVQTKESGKADLSPWVFDPKDLEGKSLDDLNVMVLERDDSVEPFQTKEEAIAFLSQDHGK